MKNVLSTFDGIPYFTTAAVKQLRSDISEESILNGLHRSMRNGKIVQLKKGFYMSRAFFERHRTEEDFSALVSKILIPKSYISLEYVLQKYGILTDVTYPITAITTKQTRTIDNTIGTFEYHNIKSTLYNGYVIRDYLGVPIAYASLSKALFDYFYLRPFHPSNLNSNYSLAEELRLNLAGLPDSEVTEFARIVEECGRPKMLKIFEKLRMTIWRP